MKLKVSLSQKFLFLCHFDYKRDSRRRNYFTQSKSGFMRDRRPETRVRAVFGADAAVTEIKPPDSVLDNQSTEL
ncbi:MAG: hypothetical protein M3T96_07260 [Acidobacteriota bacterium]|nr:hypothetical protein [Acidobacteriota bacterium]